MRLSFRILGCGSSGGVPRLDGNWGDCDPENPKNRRTRCSLLVQRTGKEGTTNVLIDTSPDMRNQLIDANVTWLDAILYSHDHADQTHGIDDVRAMVYAKQKRIEVWMDEATSQTLTSRFGYCFEQSAGTLYPAILKDNRIKTPYREITVAGEGGTITATPFRQIHGNIDSSDPAFKILLIQVISVIYPKKAIQCLKVWSAGLSMRLGAPAPDPFSS